MRLVLSLLFVFVAPLVHACSLCGPLIKRTTFGQDADRAPIILYGRITDSRLNADPRAVAGSGSHDFEIERILKGDAALVMAKKYVFPSYIPVLDPKDPPRFVMFCEVAKGTLTPQAGRPVAAPAVLDIWTAPSPPSPRTPSSSSPSRMTPRWAPRRSGSTPSSFASCWKTRPRPWSV
jgi:hypothetical protein